MNSERMDYAEVAHRISGWIRQQVRNAGADGVTLGLSGGIDSAVVLGLCRRAFNRNVLGVILPCESEEHDMAHALDVADAFDAETVTVELDDLYEDLLLKLPEEGNENARANLKPRLRMTVLYFFANSRDALVVGTSNRSELAVGYFTKHGDGGSDILPIGGLLKMDVRGLARELGVPTHIIEKPPSAGLWPGQTDEQELGLSYDTVDEIVAAMDADREPEADPDDVRRIRKLMASARHKRRMPPVCPVSRIQDVSCVR
jgi:NAD+ synthase